MYLLTWNPKRWTWTDQEDNIQTVQSEGSLVLPWSCGTTRKIRSGDRVFLMRLGVEPKGIIGSGIVVKALRLPAVQPKDSKDGTTFSEAL